MTEDSQDIQMKKEIPVSFLLDEVRCGFVIPAAIKQAWAAELTVLQEIDRVCRKHHITYYADWGTLLGCVRHGGFVPWDDDIEKRGLHPLSDSSSPGYGRGICCADLP